MSGFFNGINSWKQRIKELNILKSTLKKYVYSLDWKNRYYVESLLKIIDLELDEIYLQINIYKKKKKEEDSRQMKLDI